MPNVKLSHDENRVKICAVCNGRSGSKATQKVTDFLEPSMKTFVFAEYDKSDPMFPTGLCTTCRISLMEHMNGSSLQNREAPRKLLIPDPDTFDVQLRRVTRSSVGQDCECNICSLARLNGLELRRFLAECKKVQTNYSPGVQYEKLCKDCFAPIYRGSNHSEDKCKSRRKTIKNLNEAVQTSNTSMDLVASTYLRTTLAEAESSTVDLRSGTGGRKVSVTLGRPCGDVLESISAQQAKVIQKDARLSDSQMGKVFKNLRLQFGRKVVESGMRETPTKEKQKFDQFFSADLIKFKDNDGSLISMPAVFCSNIVGFVNELMELRRMEPGDMKLKVGLDKGRGHLKMILSMYNPNEVMKNKGIGRVTMKMGIGPGDDYSQIGKRKIMILAIVPDIPENY